MGFGPDHSPIGKLLENGPHAGGWKGRLDAHLLESAFDLMKNDPRLTLGDALQQVDVDLSNIPQSVMNDIVRGQPADVQARVEHWATGNHPAGQGSQSGGLSTSLPSGSTTAGSTTAMTAGLSGNTPSGNAYGLAGSPPGLHTSHGPGPAEMGARLGQGPSPGLGSTSTGPSPMIQRVFNGEGARTEGPLNPAAPPRTTGGETLRTDTNQAVAMPREGNGDAHRAERMQSNPVPNAPMQRGEGQGAQRLEGTQNAPALAQSRNEAAAPQQSTGLAAHGGVSAQQAMAQTAPQGAAQAAGFSTQQATAQLAPQQAGNRQMGEQGAQQQVNPRAADAAVGSQRVQDARPALAAADPRGFTPQQALASQAVSPAQARPDIANAVVPQLAGLGMVANAQAVPHLQPGQAGAPVPSGAETPAQARDGLLAPAGHTLAGFLRRDHRGSQRTRDNLGNWLLALVPGARQRRPNGEANATSFQWLFWILTIVAYGSLAMAVIVMIPDGGRLIDGNGTPSIGAYALAVGGFAAITSWFVGRRLAKRLSDTT